jgi:hypothetical protein
LRAQIPFSGCRAGYRQKGDPGEGAIRTVAGVVPAENDRQATALTEVAW